MKKKKILLLAILIICVFPYGRGVAYGQQRKTTTKKYTNEKDNKPNIIFILTDDMGWGDLGIFYQNKRKQKGEPFERSPNLDKLAVQGAQLRDHYAAAPVCAPSRASILLGLSQGHANLRNNRFDKALEDNHTMGSVLQKLGYSTVVIGKWGLQGNSRYGGTHGANWPANPLNRGFNYFLGYMRHLDGHEHYPKEGLYGGSKQVWQNNMNITEELNKTYTTDLWTAAAKHWIVKHEHGKSANKPFFMYLAYDTPHAPLELPTQAYPSGGGLRGGMQWLGKARHMINTASGKVDSWIHPDYAHATYDDDNDPSTPQVPWPAVYKRYATANRRIDSGVGDIMQLLNDLHIADNTLVVFTSDNGPSKESYLNHKTRKVNKKKTFTHIKPTFFRSFGPFDGIKRDTWEGGERVPALVRWPNHISAGQVIKSPSISYDWLSTFTAAAGIPGPEESDGVSLLPQLTGKGHQKEPLIYVEYYHPGRTPNYNDFAPQHRGRKRGQMQMIRMGNYVGVRYNIKEPRQKFEIYNITKDPSEHHNLAKTNKYPETHSLALSLQKKMQRKVLEVRQPNKSTPRPYDDLSMQAVNPKKITQGVTWKLYKGQYPWVPKVNSLHSSKTGTAAKPRVNMVKRKSSEVVYYNGYLKIPKTGQYTFYLKTDTRAEFRIHEATVIDADYGYWGGVWKQGTVRLKAGLHPFHIYYQRISKLAHPLLKLHWAKPGKDFKYLRKAPQIPTKVFYRRKE